VLINKYLFKNFLLTVATLAEIVSAGFFFTPTSF